MFPPEFPGFHVFFLGSWACDVPTTMRLTPPDSCAPTQKGKRDSQRMWDFKPTNGSDLGSSPQSDSTRWHQIRISANMRIYHLVMTNSSPWKIPKINGGFVRWENHLFLWAIYTMAMLNNKRVSNIATENHSISKSSMIYKTRPCSSMFHSYVKLPDGISNYE